MRSIIPDDAIVDTSNWITFEQLFPLPVDNTEENE